MENDVIIPTKKGTPQGGNLSPLLSNIMLNELDKELEKRGLRFVRYADNCLIMVRSEKAANRVMESITTFITRKLCLKVNVEKSKVARPNEIKYLGFGFYKKNSGVWRPKPHIKSIQKFLVKLRYILRRNTNRTISQIIKEHNYLIRGWVNYFRISDMKCFLIKIDGYIRRKIRVIIWKKWKVTKKKYNMLRKLGIQKEDARRTAGARRKYYHVAHTPVLERAISKKLLNKIGLVNALDQYMKFHTITS